MKKILAVLAVVLLSRFSFAGPSTIGTEPPSAGWNFGNVTYGQEGGSLVLNSLSDRYGISTFQTANTNGQATQLLGTNDYIEENAVKNQLAVDGYTVAYDLNPSYLGLYPSAYNQPLPTNVPLTELSFTGLAGDPTKIQNVYVLTSEYNALSSQGQAASISTLNTNVSVNATNIGVLQTGLATTNSNLAVTNSNVSSLQSSVATSNTNISNLTTQTNTNASGIAAINNMTNPNTVLNRTVNGNTVAIANETVRAQGAEGILTNGLNQTNTNVSNLSNYTVASVGSLQGQVNATNSSLVGTQNMTDNSVITNTVKNNTANIGNLYTGLNNETVRATGVETGLQNQVSATNGRVNDLDNRVDKLERMKLMADVGVRLLDTKKYTVGLFDEYDGTNQRNFAYGARIVYKLGKSYEEKTLEAQKKQIDNQAAELFELRAMVHNLVQQGAK
jgi:hypothetical protein